MKTAHPADLVRLAELAESFPRQTVVVLGDFVADEFVSGDISRVSREAPVLILRHRETQALPGGGANAVNNLADLGAKVLPVGAVGDDAAGEALVEYFRTKGVDVSGVQRVRGWTTPAKTRFLAGWTHTTRQQVLRMDREPASVPPAETAKALARAARERLRGAAAVAISDYGYGAATPAIVRQALAGGGQRRKGKPGAGGRRATPATLDSRYRLHEFAGMGLAAATPNESEVEAAHHEQVGGNLARLERLARRTMARMGLGALLVTRGRDGMAVFERGRTPQALPIVGSDQAVDVTGAGDTVLAAFSLALAAGATVLEAAHLADYAAGIVVMKRGTATVTAAELAGAIRTDATGTTAASPGKILRLMPQPRKIPSEMTEKPVRIDTQEKILMRPELLRRAAEHRARGQRIVLANGCFDLLHVGHARYLEGARREGDVLVVAVNSDSSVRTYKGDGRPILPDEARARLVAALGAVDYVTVFDEPDVIAFLEALRPDVHAKGTDYTIETVPERDTARRLGVRIAIVGDPKQHSTRGLLARLRAAPDDAGS